MLFMISMFCQVSAGSLQMLRVQRILSEGWMIRQVDAETVEIEELKGELIEGNSGIFKLTVSKKTEAPKLDNYSTYATSVKASRASQVNTAVYNALKEASEIEDKRGVFY